MLDVEAQEGKIAYLYIVDLNTIMTTSLYVHFLLSALDAITYPPDIHDGVAIYNQSHLVVSINVEDNGFILLRYKGGIEACREVLQINARGKDRVSTIAKHNGRGDIHSGSRCSLHVCVIVVSSLYALAAKWCFHISKATLENFVACKTTSADIARLRGDLLNAFEGGYRASGKTRVVSPHHHRVDGISTQYSYFPI